MAKKKEATPKKNEAKSASGIVGRQELSRRISEQTELPKEQVSEVLEATIDTIRDALQKGDEVRLVGFGSFKVRTSAARRGVNPRDRQPIEISAKERVRFFPGKELSEAVSQKYEPPPGEPPDIPLPPTPKPPLK